MTDEIREKYQNLLKGGETMDAMPDEREFCVGYLLQKERYRRNLTLKEITEGICKPNALSRMEQDITNEGKKTPSCFLVSSLLTRMGMSAKKFEFYYDRREAILEEKRKRLSAWKKYLRNRKREKNAAYCDKTVESAEKERAENLNHPDQGGYRNPYDVVGERKVYRRLLDGYEKKRYEELEQEAYQGFLNGYEKKRYEGLEQEAYQRSLNGCEKKRYEELEQEAYWKALDTYQDMCHTVWDQTWVDWQKRIDDLSCGVLPADIEAIWNSLCKRKLFYIQEEWEFLYALADTLEQKGEYSKANRVYLRMYENATKPGMDDERQLELLPEFCLVYGSFLVKYEKSLEDELSSGRAKTAEEIFLQGISLNRRFGRAYFFHELLKNYFHVLFRKFRAMRAAGQDGETRQMIREREKTAGDLQQYGKYLAVWELVCGNIEEAENIMDMIRGENGWDNSTLDYTCAVLAKRQD